MQRRSIPMGTAERRRRQTRVLGKELPKDHCVARTDRSDKNTYACVRDGAWDR
jgi:hypothetical protein